MAILLLGCINPLQVVDVSSIDPPDSEGYITRITTTGNRNWRSKTHELEIRCQLADCLRELHTPRVTETKFISLSPKVDCGDYRRIMAWFEEDRRYMRQTEIDALANLMSAFEVQP